VSHPILALTLSATLALAGPAGDASSAVQRAEAAYVAEDWNAASKAFEEAYAADPNPVFLYARAQAERLAGRCTVALDLYDRFLATKPPKEAEQEARINRARCEAVVEAPPPPDVEPGPGDEGSDGPATPPWYKDPVGGSLVGVGVVTTAIGGGLLGIALANDGDAVAADNEDAFIEAKDSAKVRHRVGIALVSVGVALAVAGAIRWGLVARRTSSERRAKVSPTGLTLRF
jgi:hypothetical protein